MRQVSDDYKNKLNENALTPKSKIVVDGVEYLGNVIKTQPKITHSATSIVGCFPSASLSFEIYNFNDDIDFENKELIVYKGLVINKKIEYVKQGVFIPRMKNITNNINKKIMSFKDVLDKTQLLENTYTSNLSYNNDETHTGLEIVQEICDRNKIVLATKNFAFANYKFKKPNISNKHTDRMIVAAIAGIGGEIAIFNSEGELEIKSQTITNETINRNRYEKVTREKEIIYNTVVLGKEGYDDNIVYPESINEKRIELKINDNPFVDLYRQEMIEEVAKHIIGLKYIPFTLTNFVDGFLYELNDVVEVTDKNGNLFNAVILDIQPSSRIKGNSKADTFENKTTDYKLAGSNKNSINELKLQVDYNKNTIEGLINTQDEQSEKIAKLEMDNSSIKESVESIEKDLIPTATASGSNIHLEDASDNKMLYLAIEGKSYQEVKKGKNLYDYKDTITVTSGITIDSDGWITVSHDNSSSSSARYFNYYTNPTDFKDGVDYNIITEIKEVSGTGYLSITSGSTTSQLNVTENYGFKDLKNGDVKSFICKATNVETATYALRTFVGYNAGQSGSITFRISVLEDTSITPENFIYEPYINSPSPENPSEIKSVGKLNDDGKYQIDISINDKITSIILDEPIRSLPNEVKDILYLKDNHLYLDRKIGKYIFDGSENWTNHQLDTSKSRSKAVLYNITSLFNIKENCSAYSNIYKFKGNINSSDLGYGEFSINDTLNLTAGTEANTVNRFKNWIRDHKPEIIYELEEAITDDLGEFEMPSTVKNITDITTTDELEPIINIEYVRDTDLSNYIDEKLQNEREVYNRKFSEFEITDEEIRSEVSETQTTVDNNYQDLVGKIGDSEENLNELKSTVENLQTSTDYSINILEQRINDGVKEVITENHYVFNKDGLLISEEGAPTGLKIDESGQEVLDKTGANESTLQYNGYVTDELVKKTPSLEKYKGQTVNYSKSIIFEQYLSSPNYRLEEFEDAEQGKCLGVFYTGGE